MKRQPFQLCRVILAYATGAAISVLLSAVVSRAQPPPVPAADGPVIRIPQATTLISVLRRLAVERNCVIGGVTVDAGVLQEAVPPGAYRLKEISDLIQGRLKAEECRVSAEAVTFRHTLPAPVYKLQIPLSLSFKLLGNSRCVSFFNSLSSAQWQQLSAANYSLPLQSFTQDQQALLFDMVLRSAHYTVDGVSLVDMPKGGFTVKLLCQADMYLRELHGKGYDILLAARQ